MPNFVNIVFACSNSPSRLKHQEAKVVSQAPLNLHTGKVQMKPKQQTLLIGFYFKCNQCPIYHYVKKME